MDTESKRADEAMRESERRYSLLFDHCAGASVTAAANAHDALEARDPFDVILSDIAMPEMDGFAFLRRMRSRATATDIPAIALTAYARQEDVERALGSGFQEHLKKPVEPGKLLEAVNTWGPRRSLSAWGRHLPWC